MAVRRLVAPLLGIAVLTACSQAYVLTGIVRDFKEWGTAGGHIDFQHFITGVTPGMLGPLYTTTLNGSANPVYTASGGYGGVDSAASFDQWYNDVAGVNLSTLSSITLAEGPPGTFSYSAPAFYPIDGLLFGNQGRGHNYAFTYEIAAEFTYRAGTGQYWSFTGDDDVWAFFNNRLAVDIGGVHGAASGSVNLDLHAADLGLVDGGVYAMNFFFAERHTSESTFSMTTNIDLRTTSVPEPFTMALMGGAALAGYRKLRRKKA